MRRILTVALCAVMLLTCVFPTALSASAEKSYTAVELLEKDITEIVEMMGSDFYLGQELEGTYITNSETLPNYSFFLKDCNVDTTVNTENIKTDISAGKYELEFIKVFGEGKLDVNISADMSYNELTKYFGEFSCKAHANYIYYKLPDGSGTSLNFPMGSGAVNAEELKVANPKLRSIMAYPGYVPTTEIIDTDSTTDTDNNEPTKKAYTAAELVKMDFSEIIALMGGNYELNSDHTHIISIYNEDVFSGMTFFSNKTISDITELEQQKETIKSDLENDIISLYYIEVSSPAVLDDNIKIGMSYSELTEYFGDFGCSNATSLHYTARDTDNNATVTLMFDGNAGGEADNTGFVSADIMKSYNPNLVKLLVYPDYVPVTKIHDTQSDTDTMTDTDTTSDTDIVKDTDTNSDTNTDTDTSTDTDTTSDTDTSNNTDSDKNTSSNTSSNTTSKNNTTNNKTNNTTTTTTTTTATVATNGITNIFVFIGVLAVSSIAIIYILKKRKEN